MDRGQQRDETREPERESQREPQDTPCWILSIESVQLFRISGHSQLRESLNLSIERMRIEQSAWSGTALCPPIEIAGHIAVVGQGIEIVDDHKRLNDPTSDKPPSKSVFIKKKEKAGHCQGTSTDCCDRHLMHEDLKY